MGYAPTENVLYSSTTTIRKASLILAEIVALLTLALPLTVLCPTCEPSGPGLEHLFIPVAGIY